MGSLDCSGVGRGEKALRKEKRKKKENLTISKNVFVFKLLLINSCDKQVFIIQWSNFDSI